MKKLTCFNFNVFRSRFVLQRKNLGFFLVLKKVSQSNYKIRPVIWVWTHALVVEELSEVLIVVSPCPLFPQAADLYSCGNSFWNYWLTSPASHSLVGPEMDGNLNLLTQMRYVANCNEEKDLGSDLPSVGLVLNINHLHNQALAEISSSVRALLYSQDSCGMFRPLSSHQGISAFACS